MTHDPLASRESNDVEHGEKEAFYSKALDELEFMLQLLLYLGQLAILWEFVNSQFFFKLGFLFGVDSNVR